MKENFCEISGSDKWRTIEPINKGWSNDKKYHIVTNRGMQLLLRISDISKYEVRKKDYETLKRLDEMDVLISRPIDFGVCSRGRHVYFLLSWLSGEDLKDALCTLNNDEQYKLGVKAGEALRKLHSIPAPENYILWTN